MKFFEDYADQSNSQNEHKRLVEAQRKMQLQESVIKQEATKKYSDREMEGMEGRSKRFANDMKRDGRAQPLRATDTMFDKARKKISKINAVTNVASKINWSNDGLYFVVFMVSVIGDVGTAAIGAAESATGGIIAVIFGLQAEMFVIGTSATIMMLYIMNGHYKRKRAVLKVAVLLGFTFTELMPVVTALPGFVGSFIINYIIVLYGRTVDEALARDSKIGKAYRFVAGQKGATRNRAKINI
jgi:hypothetical protein